MLVVALIPGTAAAGGGGGGGTGAGGCAAKTITVGSAALTGCFATKGGRSEAEGRVTINGATIDVANGSNLIVDTSARTITASKARVSVARPGGTTISLSNGAIDWHVPGGGSGPIGTISTQNVGNLLGFALPGVAQVSVGSGKTLIHLNVHLPKPVFLDASGQATLQTTTAGGLQSDSLHIAVSTAVVGPLQFGTVAIDYSGTGDTWTGTLDLALDLPQHVDLKGTIGFTKGDVVSIDIAAGFKPPFPIYPEVGLAAVNGGVHFKSPFDVHGGVSLVAGPVIPIIDVPAIEADIQGKISFPGSPAISVDIAGTVKAVTIPIASAAVHYDTDGNLTIHGEASFNAYIASGAVMVDGGLTGHGFFLQGGAQTCAVIGCAVVKGIISDVGAAACGGLTTDIKDAAVGFGILWGKSADFFDSCDLSDYESVLRTTPARDLVVDRFTSRQAAGNTVTVPEGTKAIAFKLSSTTAPPIISALGPSGQRIDGPAAAPADGPAAIVKDPLGTIVSYGPSKATYVLLLNPAPGVWNLAAQAGSDPVTAVAHSTLLPQPKIKATVAGKGRRHTVRFSITPLAGQTVRFAERAAHVSHLLKDTGAKAGAGTFGFTAGDGPGGRRDIVADVSQNGLPRTQIVVAHYTAPKPAHPGRVGGVRLTRSGRSVSIHWHAARGATKYVVRVRLRDGHRVTRVLPAARHSVTIAAFAPRLGGTASVVAVDRTGRRGSPGTAGLRRARR
jgi:hypothetical protein